MIAIIDYEMGNIHSVQKAFESFGEKTLVTGKPDELMKCEKAVLPGVGAFDDAMRQIKKAGLLNAIKDFVKRQSALLGICLGMQLLFDSSQEAQTEKGLGLLGGVVKKFDKAAGIKIPHMGWNQLIPVARSAGRPVSRKCPLLKNICEGAYVYFCHSFYPEPADESIVAATTEYGPGFASLVFRGNLFGAQFHPEKSQAVGLSILKNFVEIC